MAKYGSLLLGTTAVSAASYLHSQGNLYKTSYTFDIVGGQVKHPSNPQFYAPNINHKSWELNQTTRYELNIPDIPHFQIFKRTKPIGYINYEIIPGGSIPCEDSSPSDYIAWINSLKVNIESSSLKKYFLEKLTRETIKDIKKNNQCKKIRTHLLDECKTTLLKLGFKGNSGCLKKDLTEDLD